MQTTAGHKLKKAARRNSDGLAIEQEAFRRLFKGLLPRYRNQFVALSGGHVIGHGSDDEALAERMFAKLGSARFAIFRVAETAQVHELDSPELVG